VVDLNGISLEVQKANTVTVEGGLDGFTVGGCKNIPDVGWHGLIAEVLVYDRDLKEVERKQVGLYLAEKYGIFHYGGAILSKKPVVAVALLPGSLKTALTLENDRLGAKFDSKTGSLIQLANKLTGETLDVGGDEFEIEASEFTLLQKDATLVSLVKKSDEQLEATYEADGREVVATWRLGKAHHFLEKQLTIRSSSRFGLRKLVISKPAFAGSSLEFVDYRHMETVTFFGRSPRGGIFTGVEMAFDQSSQEGQNMVCLGYMPNLNVDANEQLVCIWASIGNKTKSK